jgi:hypothetical protein
MSVSVSQHLPFTASLFCRALGLYQSVHPMRPLARLVILFAIFRFRTTAALNNCHRKRICNPDLCGYRNIDEQRLGPLPVLGRHPSPSSSMCKHLHVALCQIRRMLYCLIHLHHSHQLSAKPVFSQQVNQCARHQKKLHLALLEVCQNMGSFCMGGKFLEGEQEESTLLSGKRCVMYELSLLYSDSEIYLQNTTPSFENRSLETILAIPVSMLYVSARRPTQ